MTTDDKNPHFGSTFDSLLKELGIYDECSEHAKQEIANWQLDVNAASTNAHVGDTVKVRYKGQIFESTIVGFEDGAWRLKPFPNLIED